VSVETSSAETTTLSRDHVAYLADKCAPSIAVSTLEAVAKTESNLNPWALHDNTTGVSESPIDGNSAFIDATAWISHGDSVDIGMTVRSALDPCRSLAGGAAVLQAAYGGGQTTAEQQVALLMALSRYNTGSPLRGIMNGYARRVIANADDPNAPPSWDVSAVGTYAQNHGAGWLIPLNTPRHLNKTPDSPAAPATMQDTSVANNLGITTTQEPMRSP
jgi:type IV secretion system protein VirB1